MERLLVGPTAEIACSGGISAVKWAGPTRIYAGCASDHSIKMVNAEKQQVEEVIFTSHKVPTCLDTIHGEDLILTGHEDGIVRLWDARAGSNAAQQKLFDCGSKWVSQVRVNGNVENVFLTGSYNGDVRLWDLRNEEEPLCILKRTNKVDDYRVFAVEWNGPSQILSGGSDSQVTVHTIGEKKE